MNHFKVRKNDEQQNIETNHGLDCEQEKRIWLRTDGKEKINLKRELNNIISAATSIFS